MLSNKSLLQACKLLVTLPSLKGSLTCYLFCIVSWKPYEGQQSSEMKKGRSSVRIGTGCRCRCINPGPAERLTPCMGHHNVCKLLDSWLWLVQSTQALPFGTILVILVIWALVTIPLCILGGIMGKNNRYPLLSPVPCSCNGNGICLPTSPMTEPVNLPVSSTALHPCHAYRHAHTVGMRSNTPQYVCTHALYALLKMLIGTGGNTLTVAHHSYAHLAALLYCLKT